MKTLSQAYRSATIMADRLEHAGSDVPVHEVLKVIEELRDAIAEAIKKDASPRTPAN